VVTVIWEGSSFQRDKKELLEHKPRWRDGFHGDAGLLGLFAAICLCGAITRYGENSFEGWTMAFIGFFCVFMALAKRRVLVELPVWLVSTSLSGLPLKVVAPADHWSDRWRDPNCIALELRDAINGEAQLGLSFRRIGVGRFYVDRTLLPKVRAIDWREEFQVLPVQPR
jgi:hypothetical protein